MIDNVLDFILIATNFAALFVILVIAFYYLSLMYHGVTNRYQVFRILEVLEVGG